jgi:hypothetical protein
VSAQILDGGGSGRLADVDTDRRLATASLSTPRIAGVSANQEKAFAVPSGVIALTAAAGESGILYYENTSPERHAVHQIHLGEFANVRWRLYRNVAAGTLVSGGSAVVPRNLNIASPVNLGADAKSGADGDTVTDGEVFDAFLSEIGSLFVRLDGALIVGPSTAIAITCEPLADTEVTATLLVASE